MNFLFQLLADDAAAGSNSGKNNWIMWVIIAVVLVLMIVLTIVPQKKRQKEQQKMMNALTVGTKLMTVGGIVGKIVQVNADNTLLINVGTDVTPTIIVIDKKAVGYVLEAVQAPAPAVEETKEETPAENEGEVVANENVENAENTENAENVENAETPADEVDSVDETADENNAEE